MAGWHDFENIDTESLIKSFQDRRTKKIKRDNILLALIFRFRKDLIEKCEIICQSRGYDIDIAILIAKNTFKNYAKSGTFKVSECKESYSIDECFLFYLFKIARNELIDYHKREIKRKKGLLYDGTESIVTKLPTIKRSRLDTESKIIHDTIISLPYSHQVIYLTYKTHEKPGVNLPRKLQAELREHLGGIDQKTVRSYKKNAIDRIKEAKRIIRKLSNEENE